MTCYQGRRFRALPLVLHLGGKMVEASIQFSDGYTLNGDIISEAKEVALEAVKQILPDEAKRPDVIRYILEETKELVNTVLLR